jgi:hypothetical protein
MPDYQRLIKEMNVAKEFVTAWNADNSVVLKSFIEGKDVQYIRMINHTIPLKKATLSWALAKCDENIKTYTSKMTGNPVIKPRRPVILTVNDIRRPVATWAETDEALRADNEALKGMLRAISERLDIIQKRTGGEPFSETGEKVTGDCCDSDGYVVWKGQICGGCDREGDGKPWKDDKPLW